MTPRPPLFTDLIRDRLTRALAGGGTPIPDGFIPEVTATADTSFGDYQCNAAMVLAKQLKTNPRTLADQIVSLLDVSDFSETPQVAGPGFINFRILPAEWSRRMAALLVDDRLGVHPAPVPKTIVIDFSGPNVAKPMHVGHIRSTIIGDCLSRVARFLGHRVITDNHVGDWGTQFGMILWGWKNILGESDLGDDPVAELVAVYKQVNARAKESQDVLDACRSELVKLQSGDPENLAIWKRCVDLSLAGLKKIYARLGVTFDHYLGESFFNDLLAPLVGNLVAEGIARESDGALCVFSDGTSDPKSDPFLVQRDGAWQPNPCLVRKSDGGFNYATTDLATIKYRLTEWGADEIWYVVGAPQQLHFRQVFAVAKRRGASEDLIHVAFGSILGEDGKPFRTRDGESVQLADVLEEAVDRARKVIEEKNPDLQEAEKSLVAENIGLGSVKYAELSNHRLTDYKFSWDRMLALEGNTAPYLLYAYVRTRSIFRKLGESGELTGELALAEKAEIDLARKLNQFAETVPDILNDFRPNLLANYLYDLATAFHAFFNACPVLKSHGQTRTSRLALCELTSRVLKRGLALLGIDTVERM